MTGQVRITWRHFAFLGPESVAAAEASECAAEQGAFWPYRERLFAAQSGRNAGAFSRGNLVAFAADLSLDATSFAACVDERRYAGRVATETELGRRRGVARTPTLIVNERRIEGVPTWEELRLAVSAATRGA